MTRAQKVRPIIQKLAEWAVDDALASHDAGYPPRKRLPREHYKKKLVEESISSRTLLGQVLVT